MPPKLFFKKGFGMVYLRPSVKRGFSVPDQKLDALRKAKKGTKAYHRLYPHVVDLPKSRV